MQNAILAVIGAALLAWIITALRQKSGMGMTFPQAFFHTFFKFVFGVRYRGFDQQVADLRGPVLYLVSTQSRLDRPLLKTYLPVGTFHVRLDDNPQHIKPLIKSVLTGRARVCLYAPGNVELDESVMASLADIGEIVRQTDARVVPIYIRGTRNSFFSNWSREKAPRGLLPQITVTAAPPFTLRDGTRINAADHLLDGMMLAKLRSANFSLTIFEALVSAARIFGMSRHSLEDAMGGKLTYGQLLIGIRALGTRFAAISKSGEAVGVLLPNANGLVLTIGGLLSAARPAALLNYTAGPAAVMAAIDTAAVRTVIASRTFVERAGLDDLVEKIKASGTSVLYLEDMRKEIGAWEKAMAFLKCRRPVTRSAPIEPAVILFTSGSESAPKGVVLSSRNLIANAAQVECRVDFSQADTLFNALPLFHSFGLLGGMVLPLLFGVRLVLYPSPLHYKLIPAMARKVSPTVMFGTETFLAGYGKAAKDGDFDGLRMIVAGAEPVKPETRRLFQERFNVPIVEGYGMTEASPVVALNSKTFSRQGAVGRLLPGMEMRIEPVEGIAEGGRLFVAGPNVMQGYMLADKPGVLQPVSGKWHDSGDIVSLDERDFITIKGRARRFAKIAGEMVSLGAVENMVRQLWPDSRHAVISVPDKRRGERIVLVTTQGAASRDDLLGYARRYGATELMLPAEIIHIADIPVLGSGKIDYPGTLKIVQQQISA